MKTKHILVGMLLLAVSGWPPLATAGGLWVPVANLPSGTNGYFGHMHLLTDGRVMSEQGSTHELTQGPQWWLLQPDSLGHYTNVTWTNTANMKFLHEDFGSQVLQNGKVMVAGGEVGGSGNTTEIYDPLSNTWTQVTVPGGLTVNISDAISMLLPNGRMMVAPVNPANTSIIYDPVANTWSAGPGILGNQNESCWVKLADDSILTIDISNGGTNSERFIPSLNQWVKDANVPAKLFSNPGGEIGPAMLLPNGKVICFGGTTNNVIYTPSPLGGTNDGTWTLAPSFPNDQSMPDAPAAMLVNGRILCAVATAPYYTTNGSVISTNTFNSPVSFYEYDYINNNFTQVSAPGGGSTFNDSCWPMLMLNLPDGTVMLSDRNTFLYVYQPTNATPMAAAKPLIQNASQNSDGSLHLTGTLFNGISAGAAYGDDEQEDSNYPLVRFTDASGTVRYGRTHGWSSTSVMTGTAVLTTECTIPSGGSLNDTIQVVANGIASDPVALNYAVNGITWVDFNFGGTENGSFDNPWNSLSQGNFFSSSGGLIAVKAGSSSETLSLTKPVRIVSYNGTVHIGP